MPSKKSRKSTSVALRSSTAPSRASTPAASDLPPLHAAPGAPSEDTGRAEFERTRAAREGLTAGALLPIGYDLPTAWGVVHAALPGLQVFRPGILALGGMTAAQFDALGDTAMAARFAHTHWVVTTRPQQPLPDLIARATEKRDTLLNAAVSAADKGIVPRDKLPEFAGGRSAREIAGKLARLRVFLHGFWPALVGRTSLEATDLDEAQALADELQEVLSLRDNTDPVAAQASDDRQRAATVLTRDWDEVRRAMAFIRYHEGDAEQFAPSLYQRSPPRREEPATQDAPGAPPPPTPANPNAPAATTNGQPATTNGHSTDTTVGLPNSSPFIKDPNH